MTEKPKNMRAAMPKVAAWIDGLRLAFGVDDINASMCFSIPGQPVFWASEGGSEVGTRHRDLGTEISAAKMVIVRTTP